MPPKNGGNPSRREDLCSMYPGVYCTEHIIFLLAAGLVAVSRFADTEKKKTAVIKSSAALLLVWILTNRISVTAGSIAEDLRQYRTNLFSS